MNYTKYLIALFIVSRAYCQSDERSYKPLSVGDTAPNYSFANMMNYSNDGAKLHDFKGKLLILDFWSSYCGACIKSWPKLLELQRQFGDSIQIILPNTKQDRETVEAVIERQKKINNVDMTLPIIYSDTTLEQLFPYSGMPHVVWLDDNSKVISITEGDVLNAKNIRSILDGNVPKMKQKSLLDFDQLFSTRFSKPLFIDGNGGYGEEVVWRTVLANRTDGLIAGFSSAANDQQGYYITITNSSIVSLYGYAYSDRVNMYGQLEEIPYSRIRLSVQDTTQYVAKVDGEYQYQNQYVYQLFSRAPSTYNDLQKKMQADLKNHFPLKATWEKQKTTCLVFTTADTSLIKYNGGDAKALTGNGNVRINNITIDDLIDQLNKTAYYNYPLVNGTGFRGNLREIEIEDINVADYKAVDKALQKFGMSLKLGEVELDILILSD